MKRALGFVLFVFTIPFAAGFPTAQAQTQGADAAIQRGRQTFRFDTFGSQAFFGAQLRLHEALATLTPRNALSVGLKVDMNALPVSLRNALKAGTVNLDDPAVTARLLQLDSILGVKGFFAPTGNLVSVGIRCALCHSTVDDALAPGIGRRRDLWANRDLNVGAIIALAPNLQPFVALLQVVNPGIDAAGVRAVLRGWGPGKFDAQMTLDGKTTNPNTGASSATLLPPVFGLKGVNLSTSTGWGSVTYWNAFVANLEMHGKGTLFDQRLNNQVQFPIASANGFGNVRNTPDLITRKLADLHLFQLSVPAPKAPAGSFNAVAAQRGSILFEGKARCSRCHVPPLFSEPGWNMHRPAGIGIDSFQADRSPDRRYRTAPLKGLWTHTKGGFYHDGRFPTLRAVINHYDQLFGLALTPAEKSDLGEYLKSL